MCLQDVRKCSTNIIRKRIYLWQRPRHVFLVSYETAISRPTHFRIVEQPRRAMRRRKRRRGSVVQGWCKSIRIRLCNNEQSRLQQSVLTCYSDPPDIAPKSYTCTNMPLITNNNNNNNNNKGESFSSIQK